MAGVALTYELDDLQAGGNAALLVLICDQIRNIVTDLEVLRAHATGISAKLDADNVTNLDTDYVSGTTGATVNAAGDMIAANITLS